jgi:HK97 family phage prohead protease
MERIFKTYQTESKKVDELTFEALITSSAEDRQGEVVVPGGISLENFQRNPVVLYGHDYSGLPVAKATSLTLEPSGIAARFSFPENGVYDKADTVRKLWGAGFLNAVSIGFIPLERSEDGRTITKCELLEFSIVPVPANQEALRRALENLQVPSVEPPVVEPTDESASGDAQPVTDEEKALAYLFLTL